MVENKDGSYLAEKEKILFAESAGHLIDLHLEDRVIKNVRYSLEDIVKDIGEDSFVRCHKSFAVNLNNVESLYERAKRSWAFTFRNIESGNRTCLVGKTYYKAIKDRLNEMGRRGYG